MGWNSDGTWTAESDSVSERVTGLMSQDSALMRQATTNGLKTANRRGLLNSSVAAGAAQNAALAYVTPIASQEASQASTSNNNAATIKADADKTTLTLAAQEKLNQANIDAEAAKTAATIASQEKQSQASIDAEAAKTAATLAAQERAAAADAITKAQDSYSTSIANTLQNEKISAATRSAAQADMANLYSKSLATLQSLFPNVSLNWTA